MSPFHRCCSKRLSHKARKNNGIAGTPGLGLSRSVSQEPEVAVGLAVRVNLVCVCVRRVWCVPGLCTFLCMLSLTWGPGRQTTGGVCVSHELGCPSVTLLICGLLWHGNAGSVATADHVLVSPCLPLLWGPGREVPESHPPAEPGRRWGHICKTPLLSGLYWEPVTARPLWGRHKTQY